MMGLGDESGGLRKSPLAVIVHERLPAKDIGKLLYLTQVSEFKFALKQRVTI